MPLRRRVRDVADSARQWPGIMANGLRKAVFLAWIPPLRGLLRRTKDGREDVPPRGLVRFGDLRRLSPLSRDWGADRGGAVDWYYIEGFLDKHRSDIRGRVLELGVDAYTSRFGSDAVDRVDVVEWLQDYRRGGGLMEGRPLAHLPSNSFDCVLAIQTLQLVYDVRATASAVYRVLKPGGVALISVPGISHVRRNDRRSAAWCWSFTALSISRVFGSPFSSGTVYVETHGNVLAATAFLYGLGQGEMDAAELDYHDPDYEMLVTLRATKEKP